MTFRGRFAYLVKVEQQIIEISFSFIERLVIKLGIPMEHRYIEYPEIETKLGRLAYNGQMDNWSFAVFKYSREKYDENEWMFPGKGELDGTIEGSLRAGLVIYD